MSDLGELRKRLNLVIIGTAEARCADDGGGYVDVWVTNTEATADAVLAEIDAAGYVIVRADDACDLLDWAVNEMAPVDGGVMARVRVAIHADTS